MSLANLNLKQAKGKKKLLPKLKTILASPYNVKSPTLDEAELTVLANLLRSHVARYGQAAARKHLRIGLESSLRAINNGECACVLLSLNIKPRHLIHLIARNVEVKDETVPLYVQQQLDQLTEDIFGVRALAMVLPTKLQEEDDVDLWKWLTAHRLPKSAPQRVFASKPTSTKKKATPPLLVAKRPEEAVKGVNAAVTVIAKQPQKQKWNDFISFTGDNVAHEESKLEDENSCLLRNLSKMLKPSAVGERECTGALSVTEAREDAVEATPAEVVASGREATSDEDDFLLDYQPLTIHKIKGNPVKKPKRKNKKKK